MSETEGQFASGNEACRLFDAEIEAYLEGEAKPSVESHAGRCRSCGAVLADLSLIRSTAGALGMAEPPARLWPNIRAALIEEGIIRPSQKFWARWFSKSNLVLSPVAAAAMAVLVVLAATFVQRTRHLTPGPAQSPVASAASDNPVEGDLADMESSYRARSGSLDPSLRAGYEQGLQSLDGEISDLRDSVKRHPADTLARDYLNAAYVQKAQVLESALESGGR
ncbi:MAG TPA: hypothetical protein VGW33_06450 [Terriglobia bacterium]|nr:hypothetical protein [Terriglobia bacterium]